MKKTNKKRKFLILSNIIIGDVENAKASLFFNKVLFESLKFECIKNVMNVSKKKNKVDIPSLFEDVRKKVEVFIEKVECISLPQQLDELINNNHTKREQISLLKGFEMSSLQLLGLFIQAEKKGYLFSNYRLSKKIDEYNGNDLPIVSLNGDDIIEMLDEFRPESDSFYHFAVKSDFSTARILDNGKHWHCFYQTERGILGDEVGKYGSRPHIHYISDSFGVSREYFVNAFKGGHAPSSSIHILLTD